LRDFRRVGLGAVGFEHKPNISDLGVFFQSDAQSDAQWLITNWSKLPGSARRSILAVARDALGADAPVPQTEPRPK